MTDPHTWWFLENTDGRWLENIDHGAFTDDPNQALKWPNRAQADEARRGMRTPLWTLKATEHMWIEATLPPHERVKGLVSVLEDMTDRMSLYSGNHDDALVKQARSALASYRGGA